MMTTRIKPHPREVAEGLLKRGSYYAGKIAYQNQSEAESVFDQDYWREVMREIVKRVQN